MKQVCSRGSTLISTRYRPPSVTKCLLSPVLWQAGRGPRLTNEHQQGSSHGSTVGEVELQHYLIGHGYRQGPGKGWQQAQGPHRHIATVFWKGSDKTELRACTVTHSSSQTLKCNFINWEAYEQLRMQTWGKGLKRALEFL